MPISHDKTLVECCLLQLITKTLCESMAEHHGASQPLSPLHTTTPLLAEGCCTVHLAASKHGAAEITISHCHAAQSNLHLCNGLCHSCSRDHACQAYTQTHAPAEPPMLAHVSIRHISVLYLNQQGKKNSQRLTYDQAAVIY